ILKPSLWFVPLQSMFFSGVVLFITIGAALLDAQRHWHRGFYIEAAAFLIAGRLMWATLHWMGRLYVLTDLRVLRLAGVFQIDIFDCPLRKVHHVQSIATLRESFLGLGSILIIPKIDGKMPAMWQTIAHPADVQEKLVTAINKANQSGLGTP
ncbi:MAG TPA: PH domain-containing protein, partial [Tepidisphaeraceae bacterium]|nr:PH domain-containing protein [Tepidisphaeraceae bacterium]